MKPLIWQITANRLTRAIEHSDDYVAAHEKKIGEVRRALEVETKAKAKYDRNFSVIRTLPKAFVSDSAIMYFLGQCISLTDEVLVMLQHR